MYGASRRVPLCPSLNKRQPILSISKSCVPRTRASWGAKRALENPSGHYMRFKTWSGFPKAEKKVVNFTSEQILDLLHDAGREWRCPVRIRISAGAGCTVLEVFDRDAGEPSVPVQRLVLKAA